MGRAHLRRGFLGRPLGAWYRFVVARRILTTRPVACGSDSSYELHSLTFDHDLLNSLWSLKSWYYFSNTRPALVVYAGGPLSTRSAAILSEHFPGCRIIGREQFNDDMRTFLAGHPASLEFSAIKAFYCALKLFGPMFYAKSDSVLYVDSDVLFFRRPAELLGCIARRAPCYNSDYQDAYAYRRAFINDLLPVRLEARVNAGLFHLLRKDLAGGPDLAERYFEKTPELDRHTWRVNRHEQTLNALLLSKANAARLSTEYQISQTPVTGQTVSHHFVNDGSRPDFWRVGIRRLVSSGLLKALASASAR